MGAASLTELEFSGMPDDAWAHAGGPDQRHALIVGRAHPESSKTRRTRPCRAAGPRDHRRHRGGAVEPASTLMRPKACRSLSLDHDLVANILHIAVQEISHPLNGRAERETISEFGQIDRRPGAFRTECSWTTPSPSQQREGWERSAVFLRRTNSLNWTNLALLGVGLSAHWFASACRSRHC